MVRVLLMETGSFKTFGGAAVETHDIYAHLKKHNYKVDFFGDFSKIDKKLKGVDVPKPHKYDVVMLNSIRDVPEVEKLLLKSDIAKRPKTFYVDRGNVLVNFKNAGVKRVLPKMLARQHLMTRMRKWLDCYVALSAEQYEDASRFFDKHTRLLYLPITPKPAFFVSKGERKDFGVYVGRLDERQKKVGELIKNIECLTETYPGLRREMLLVVAGKGPDEDKYKGYVEANGLQKNVYFIGQLNEKALVSLYNKAGFFVSNSAWEGMSATFVEALACGLPLLINNKNNTKIGIRPPRRIVEEGYDGLVFEYGNREDFANKFYKLYTDSDFRKGLSKNALKFAKKFDKAENLKSYERIIEALAFGQEIPKLMFME